MSIHIENECVIEQKAGKLLNKVVFDSDILERSENEINIILNTENLLFDEDVVLQLAQVIIEINLILAEIVW